MSKQEILGASVKAEASKEGKPDIRGRESTHVEGALTPQVTWPWVETCSVSYREDEQRLGAIIRQNTIDNSVVTQTVGYFLTLLYVSDVSGDFYELGLQTWPYYCKQILIV